MVSFSVLVSWFNWLWTGKILHIFPSPLWQIEVLSVQSKGVFENLSSIFTFSLPIVMLNLKKTLSCFLLAKLGENRAKHHQSSRSGKSALNEQIIFWPVKEKKDCTFLCEIKLGYVLSAVIRNHSFVDSFVCFGNLAKYRDDVWVRTTHWTLNPS